MLAVATPPPAVGSSLGSVDTEYVSIHKAAKYAGLHPQTLRKAFRSGRLRGVKVNGARVLRFRLSWVRTWLEG